MPRQKKAKTKPQRAEIENAPPDVQHKMLVEMLKNVTIHMDQQNVARKEINDFHKKSGNNQAPAMNKREKNEAKTLYKKHLNQGQEGMNQLEELINNMKLWRANAINESREKGDLNAIEIMKLKHGCLPIINMEKNPEPYGAGALPLQKNTRLEKYDEVAAFVEETNTWILAEVKGSISNHRYECIDVDDQEKKLLVFTRKQLIPMPRFTVNYDKYPHMALPENAIVLAVYPGTTCFYDGIVHEPPKIVSGFYKIRFTDNQKPGKLSDPMEVSERYVVAFKSEPKSNAKKLAVKPEEEEAEQSTSANPIQAKNRGKSKDKLKEEKTKSLKEEKDIPGPAPKPLETVFYESTDDELKDKKTRRRKKKLNEKPNKIKIIRARVPPHKKIRSTRQFGKRRVKRKPKVPVGSSNSEQAKCKLEKANSEEKKTEVSSEDVFLDANEEFPGVSTYGLEEEQDDSEKEVCKKHRNKDDKRVDDVEDSNDLEENASSAPMRSTSECGDERERRNSSSDSSDSQSGISISDHERLQRGYETEDEADD